MFKQIRLHYIKIIKTLQKKWLTLRLGTFMLYHALCVHYIFDTLIERVFGAWSLEKYFALCNLLKFSSWKKKLGETERWNNASITIIFFRSDLPRQRDISNLIGFAVFIQVSLTCVILRYFSSVYQKLVVINGPNFFYNWRLVNCQTLISSSDDRNNSQSMVRRSVTETIYWKLNLFWNHFFLP